MMENLLAQNDTADCINIDVLAVLCMLNLDKVQLIWSRDLFFEGSDKKSVKEIGVNKAMKIKHDFGLHSSICKSGSFSD